MLTSRNLIKLADETQAHGTFLAAKTLSRSFSQDIFLNFNDMDIKVPGNSYSKCHEYFHDNSFKV